MVQCFGKKMGIFFIENKGRLNLDHIMVRPVGTEQDAHLLHFIDYQVCFRPRWLQGYPVPDELHPNKETPAAAIPAFVVRTFFFILFGGAFANDDDGLFSFAIFCDDIFEVFYVFLALFSIELYRKIIEIHVFLLLYIQNHI